MFEGKLLKKKKKRKENRKKARGERSRGSLTPIRQNSLISFASPLNPFSFLFFYFLFRTEPQIGHSAYSLSLSFSLFWNLEEEEQKQKDNEQQADRTGPVEGSISSSFKCNQQLPHPLPHQHRQPGV
jgi:hypothetical protein